MSYQNDPHQAWGSQGEYEQPGQGPAGWGQGGHEQPGQEPGYAPPGWGQPGYGQAPPGYQQYPPSPQGGFEPPRPQSTTLSTLSIVFGIVAFLFIPIGFGIAGLVCGIVANNRNQPRAMVGIVLSIVGLVVGTILGIAVAHTVV
jgi:hypothetical protein